MIWIGLALGFLLGAAFSGFILYLWVAQDPRRLGYIIRVLVEAMARHNGGLFIKMYGAIFETRRASKMLMYVKPEDLAEAIGWYARKTMPIPLDMGKGMADGCRESQEDPRSEP